MNILNRLLLIILRNRLRGYKRNEKYYVKIADETNFYTSVGIPILEKQIKELEDEIKNGSVK